MAALTVWVVGSADSIRGLARTLDVLATRLRDCWKRFMASVTIFNDTNVVHLRFS